MTTLIFGTNGFSFQSNRGNQHMFTALIPLKSDFTSGWETVKKANIVAATAESVGQKVSYLQLLDFYLFKQFFN